MATQSRGLAVAMTPPEVDLFPRTGLDHAELVDPERAFARKYGGSEQLTHDGRHPWLRVVPDKTTSWDFRKLPPQA